MNPEPLPAPRSVRSRRRRGCGVRRATLTLAALAGALGAAPVKLDLGTPESPVAAGWLQVTQATAFDATAPAGWAEIGALVSKAIPIQRETTFSESSGRDVSPPVYATEVSCDHVEGDAAATLRVRVPDGPCRAWVLCGPAGGDRARVWDVRLTAGGSSATAVLPGAYGARILEVRAEAREGHVDLRFETRSRWLVNAVVVAPEAEWPAVRTAELAPVERDVELLPADVLATWQERVRPAAGPVPAATPAEAERGFLVYHRSCLEPVWPDSVPQRQECDPTLSAFAAWDEYEPLTFTLLPVRDLGRVSVTVSDLVAEDGQRLRSEDIDRRYVRYLYVRPNYQVKGIYYRAPDVLMPLGDGVPATAGENLRVWLTAYVAPATPGGLYRGEARVAVDGRPAATVPIRLRVLPFALVHDRSRVYGHYYHHPYSQMNAAPDAFSRAWWWRKAELEHADMAAHGLNTLVLGIGGRLVAEGRWLFDFDRFEACVQLYRRHGFDQPVICSFPVGSLYAHHMSGAGLGSHLRLVKPPPPAFFDDLTAMVATIEAERRARDWPELLYYPIDEPSTSPVAVAFMADTLKAIKRVPGVRTYVTADPAEEGFAPLRPHVDVWCSQPFSLDREAVLRDGQERHVEYWCYPNHVAGENDHTPVAGARMTYGFGFWRSGYKALTPWIYQSVVSDPWNYLDGDAMDFFNRTDDDASPIPVVLWEAYREGLDDGRYLATLDHWTRRARDAGQAAAAAAAEADRQFVWDSIRVQPKYTSTGVWEPEAFNVLRWLVADRILTLKAAVEKP